MKLFSFVLLGLVAVCNLVTASPHHHGHAPHKVKRQETSTTVIDIEFAIATVVHYQLNGQTLDVHELCDGIADGNYTLPNNEIPADCTSLAASATPTPTTLTSTIAVTSVVTATASPSAALSAEPSVASSTAEPASASSCDSSSTSAAASSSAPAPSASTVNDASVNYASATGTEEIFPDGQLDCSAFPSDYGAVALDWLNTQGWASIQTPQKDTDAGYDDIFTAISGGCTEGAFCAYACAPGYQMMQWPKKQGATGQSVGGVLCQNGKLHLTNTDMSKSLCGAGVGNVFVKNAMSQQTAVCRTIYPGKYSFTIFMLLANFESGSEDMVVPLDSQPGTTANMTCPNAQEYYVWEGGKTSAQYYLNNKGMSVPDGCVWGDGSKILGNWAPMVLGVGQNGGNKWLSLAQNNPNNVTAPPVLDFSVEIVGDNVSGTCKYSEGQFCTDTGCTSGRGAGCTVSSLPVITTKQH